MTQLRIKPSLPRFTGEHSNHKASEAGKCNNQIAKYHSEFCYLSAKLAKLVAHLRLASGGKQMVGPSEAVPLFRPIIHHNVRSLTIHYQGRNQGGLGSWSPLLARSKLRKKIIIFSRFRAYNPIKMFCNTIIPFQLSNFVAF